MEIRRILVRGLAAPTAKFLLKAATPGLVSDIGSSFVDMATAALGEESQDVAKLLQRIAEDVVGELEETFSHEIRDANPEAVAAEIAATLEALPSPECASIKQDLDPNKLADALRRVRQPAAGMSQSDLALYRKALPKIATAIVDVARDLPDFEKTRDREILERLSELAKRSRAIEASMAHLPRDRGIEEYERKYRDLITTSLNRIELFGAEVAAVAKRYSLSTAYVSLTFKKPNGNGAAESLPAQSLLDSLSPEHNRLYIVGEAGSGKTTLLRWAAIKAADLSFNAPARDGYTGLMDPGTRERPERDWWGNCIPFFVRLRDSKDGRLPPPKQLPLIAAALAGEPPKHWVQSILDARERRGLLLLDGIDELRVEDREALRNQLEDFLKIYPGCYCVVSSRPSGPAQDFWTGLGFKEAWINPLSPKDRARFIQYWYEAVAENIGEPSDLTHQAKSLEQELRDNPEIARLATNPLLCAMICAMYREGEGRLPEREAEICEDLCKLLLAKRDFARKIDQSYTPAYRALSYPQRKAFAEDIAYHMVSEDASTIDYATVLKKISDRMKQIGAAKPEDADEILKGLVERTGMLRETQEAQYDFAHNRFKEYLAAQRFVREDAVTHLVRNAKDPGIRPIVLFAAATDDEHYASKLLSRILHPEAGDSPWHEDSQEDARARRRLAVRCREVAQYVRPDVRREIEGLLPGLFPPRNGEESGDLAVMGDRALEFLDGQLENEQEAAATVRLLRLIGTQRALAALRDWLEDRRESVVMELAQAVNPLEIAAVQDLLREGAEIPEGIAPQIERLAPLPNLSDPLGLNLDGTMVGDLAPLAGLKSLRSLSLSRTAVKDLAPLAGLKSLQQLSLGDTKVSDLAPLAGLKSLQYLRVEGTAVSDLTPLAEFERLVELSLKKTAVNDLAPLAGLKSLEMLSLNDTAVGDLTPLAGLKSLKNLWLDGTAVSDLAPLAGLERLRLLSLNFVAVSDLAPLAGLKSLVGLGVQHTRVIDLTPLGGLKSLTSAWFTNTEVSDLTPLAEFERLVELSLRNTAVNDLAPLAGLKSLEVLYLDDTAVSDLTPLAGLKSLEDLYLDDTAVSDLTPLAGLKSLKNLWLNGTAVSDLTPLAGLKSLKNLWLNGTAVSDLTPLAGLKSLEWLHVNYTEVKDVTPLAGLESLLLLAVIDTAVSDLMPLDGFEGVTVVASVPTHDEDVN